MTTDDLIAQCRQWMLYPRAEVTLEQVATRLRMILDMLVIDFDHNGNPTSAAALIARCLGMIVADLEDRYGDRHLH